MARTMVENLSISINPLTGRILPPSDCCANEVVQEALKAVLEHCSLESYSSIMARQREEKGAAKLAQKERRETFTRISAKSGSEKRMTCCVISISRGGKYLANRQHIKKVTRCRVITSGKIRLLTAW